MGRRHGRFYLAVAAGGVAFAAATVATRWEARFLAAVNVFFLAYLGLTFRFVVRATAEHLKRAAATADEGLVIILGVVATAVVASLGAVMLLLSAADASPLEIGLALAAIPLGWLTVQTIASFHYADLYYAPGPEGFARGLEFPKETTPGPWDFLYFAFVIGMTAQVSDVAVSSTLLRRWVLAHGVVSFFYYTGIVALAVNALGGGS